MCLSLWEYFSYKKSFLVISEILRPFFNLLNLDDMYSVGNTKTLTQLIQTQLFKKRQIFSDFFTAFLKYTYDFGHFEKREDSHRLCISEIIE